MTELWIKVLKEEIKKASLRQVARRIKQSIKNGEIIVNGVVLKRGGSAASICQFLNDYYPGSTDNLKAIVETVFINKAVACPILGEINTKQCIKHQTAKFNPDNSLGITLFKACRTCKFNEKGEKEHGK